MIHGTPRFARFRPYSIATKTNGRSRAFVRAGRPNASESRQRTVKRTPYNAIRQMGARTKRFERDTKRLAAVGSGASELAGE